MRSINTKSRVPFAVSLSLIFSYGLLQVVVPPTVFGAHSQDTLIADEPDLKRPVEWITQAGHAKAPTQDARPSLQ